MITTTTAAISAANSAQAAAANAAAQEAARKACMALVRGYEHDRATTVEMREYAGCINRLHPTPLTEEGLGLAKAAVVVLFIAVVAGIFWDKRERFFGESWLGHICGGGIVGLLAGFCFLLAIYGAALGIRLFMM